MEQEKLPNDIDFSRLTPEILMSDKVMARLYGEKDMVEKVRLEGLCNIAAKRLKMTAEFKRLYKTYTVQAERKERAEGRNIAPQGNYIEVPDSPLNLFVGDWIVDEIEGVRKIAMRADGVTMLKKACFQPILPIERLVNIKSHTEKIKIAVLADFAWKEFVFERGVLLNVNKIMLLADYGISVSSETAMNLVSYLKDCLDFNSYIPRVASVSQMGWHDGRFLPYSGEIVFDGEADCRHLYDSIKQSGDFLKWIPYVAELRKNKAVRMQMAASFASPLIELVGGLPFILHFWGATVSAKTVSSMVTASIWGDPRQGRLLTGANSTLNNLVSTLGFFNHLPTFIDELQLIKTHENNYDKLVMVACAGLEKGRNQQGGKMLPSKTWLNSIIITGEEPIVKSDSGGGVYSRVIQIECKELMIQDGNAVVAFINDNHGFAGIAFVEMLTKNRAEAKDRYRQNYKKLLAESDINEKQAMALALMLTGDQLAEEWIFGSGEPFTVSEIAEFAFSKTITSPAERAYSWVMSWVGANPTRFNVDLDENKGEVWGKCEWEPSLELVKRVGAEKCKYGENNVVYINRAKLSAEMRRNNMDLDSCLTAWEQLKYTTRNGTQLFTHKKRIIKSMPPVGCIKLYLSTLEDVTQLEIDNS